MSRCFPFPPPGYEKKNWTDDLEPLKKEKEKDKKHKKDKKDKEKKERKEKRDKEKSEERHRDKKHRKEKQRDKKEDRDKDKDRSTNSDEKKQTGISHDQNGEKRSYEEKLPAKSKFQLGEKPNQKEKERDKERVSISVNKKHAGPSASLNGERVNKNIHLAGDSQNSQFVEELGRRIRDEGGGVRPQLAEKLTADPKRESVLRFNNSTLLAEHKEDSKRSSFSRLDGQGVREDAKIKGNVSVQNHAGAVQGRVVLQTPRQVEDDKRHSEGKEKAGERAADVKAFNKVKEKDGERKGHEKVDYKDKWREKEKPKVEGEQRKGLDNVKEQMKIAPIGAMNLKTSKSPVESNQISEGNARKRKDTDRNGFLHDDFIKSSKFPKPVSSSQTYSDSGTTSETSHGSVPPSAERLGAVTSHKVDNKERKPNGIIVSASSMKSSSGNAQGGQLRDVAPKPPHPDIKYLGQVLSVPTMEEWSEFDDQEWLFDSSKSQTKKPKLRSSKLKGATQVWSEALLIEEADVYALPYVIPY